VEVKWGVHPAGEKRDRWTSDDRRTTLSVLVQGEFRIDLTEGSRILATQGDYALWGPGIDHSWEALADSVVITVRWPSAADA
jgi:quercetin dioxygenase-like cupin family protein